MRTIYTNARCYTGSGFEERTLLVEAGRIVSLEAPAAFDEPLPEGMRRVDLGGRTVVPGLVDVHVHLREPGGEYKETIATGTAAAAAGGYTLVCPMPNLNPAPDSLETLRVELEAIDRDAAVRAIPYGCISRGRRGGGATADLAAMAPFVAGFSDDGCGVQDEEDMRRAMREAARLERPIVAHCEVNELLRGGYIHDGAYCRAHGHRGICSESEWRQVERDIRLAAETGCRYHVCHVSTAESVELVRRARAAGLPVSCETAPHYLLLSEEDLQEEGCWKMNPPLRSLRDREAIVEGVLDGTIEVIATDHAPHSAEEKSRGLAGSAMGIVGLECAFGLLYTGLVQRGLLPLERLVELMSVRPRRLFGFGGGLAAGEAADFTVLDLDTPYTIDPATFRSKGRSTPFAGRRVCGRAVMTVVGGRCVYEDTTITKQIR